MKAVRIPLATALIVVVVALNGCDLFFGTEPGPSAPRFDPPAGTYSEHLWVSIKNSEGQLYVTTDPNLEVLQFEPTSDRESIFVGDDLTIRAYVIDDRSLRSAVSEAAYVIEDAAAPVISSTAIWQTSVDYLDYDIHWAAWPPDGSNGSNPSDDLTEWHNLEFAVFASPADDIDTLGGAESNLAVTLVRDWHSEHTAGDVGCAGCTACHAGERDLEGNVSAYGSVKMESRPAMDLYLAQSVPAGSEDDEVWLNPGDGVDDPVFFSVPTPPPPVLKDTYAAALADLNDDGYDDLIACYRDGGIVYQGWFAANGNGTFSVTPVYSKETLDEASEIEIADMNRDGSPDIVFGNISTNVEVCDLSLNLLFTVDVLDTDSISVGDINGDGYPDIVTGDTAGVEKVQVWINSAGTGVTGAAQSWTGENDVTDPVDVLLKDLDGDGYSDLVVASLASAVQVYYGTSGGSLVPGPPETWAFEGTKCIEATDWDGNGWLDLIFANDVAEPPAFAYTRIYLSNGAYGFGVPRVAPLDRLPLDIEVADMNGDGWPDFVQTFAGDPIDNPFQVWLNDSTGGVFPGFSPAIGGDATVAVGRLR